MPPGSAGSVRHTRAQTDHTPSCRAASSNGQKSAASETSAMANRGSCYSPNAVSGSASCLSAAGAYESLGQRCPEHGNPSERLPAAARNFSRLRTSKTEVRPTVHLIVGQPRRLDGLARPCSREHRAACRSGASGDSAARSRRPWPDFASCRSGLCVCCGECVLLPPTASTSG